VRSIVADCVGLFFWIRKQNVVGEFARSFETVAHVELGSKKVRAL